MAIKKYPVGTKIKYIGYCKKCKGKIGKIVDIFGANGYNKGLPYITLPQSTCNSFNRNGKIVCSWEDVELLIKKNEQLEFGFMNEVT